MSTMKKILSKMRSAVEEYKMIETGDRIAIGVSGGKDSLTMMMALNNLRRFYPEKFDLVALTLDMGTDNADFSAISQLCKEFDIPYHVEKTLIGRIVFEERKEKNPCSLCANLRRGALNNLAKSLGCNKVALGHHRDDVIETLLMSLFYEGRIHTFSPVTYLGRQRLTLIRPLLFVEEKEIRAFTKHMDLPILKSTCPYDGKSKRQEMKDLLYSMSKTTHDLKSNIFGAIRRSSLDKWNTQNDSCKLGKYHLYGNGQ